MSNQAVIRIGRELSQIQRGTDLSLAVGYQESNIRNVKALIIGPPDSPYEFGFFEFAIKFSEDYPTNPPAVNCITTDGGRCRFNPNIYACGKVCLSILGTWTGSRGEQWSSAQGLESIMLSIQSLMSSNPYENEPGFEHARSNDDEKNKDGYRAKIRHETIRVSVIDRLELIMGIQADGTIFDPSEYQDDVPVDSNLYCAETREPAFEPFNDLCKRRFLWYFDSYMNTVKHEKALHKGGSRFMSMPFEGPGNTMSGAFRYGELEDRLIVIKNAIMDETKRWAEDGLKAKAKDFGLSVTMQRHFEQIVEEYKARQNFTIDLALEDENPFIWVLTYFGKPMTQLDGGVFKINIYISTKFPEEQPRVVVQTPLFHHRISSTGVMCYFPRKPEEMRSHVDAILEALEDENPAYDPRATVNPEASALLWGSSDDKKKYNRQLRRSVQRSIEE